MLRKTLALLLPLAVCGLVCSAWAKPKEITDPAEAQADPDFSIQGEYVGQGVLADGTQLEVGAQVIAQGNGSFRVALYEGGLPGAGWQRDNVRLLVEGTAAELKGEALAGKIVDRKLTVHSTESQAKALLDRTERKSPTLGAKPPAGALVLFDGSSLDQFEGAEGHLTKDKSLLAGVTSKPIPDNHRLHLEFRLSWVPEARGQARSNSGVYIYDCYECQVLDSFGLDGRDNECGGFYSIRQADAKSLLDEVLRRGRGERVRLRWDGRCAKVGWTD